MKDLFLVGFLCRIFKCFLLNHHNQSKQISCTLLFRRSEELALLRWGLANDLTLFGLKLNRQNLDLWFVSISIHNCNVLEQQYILNLKSFKIDRQGPLKKALVNSLSSHTRTHQYSK